MIHKSHFILFVRNQMASTAFYRRLLDDEPRLDVPGMTEFSLGPGSVLGLMPEAAIRRILDGAVEPGTAGGAPRAELYLHVPEPASWQARAVEAGGRALGAPAVRNWGDLVAYCLDLDGHVLAFARAVETTSAEVDVVGPAGQAGWGRPGRGESPREEPS